MDKILILVRGLPGSGKTTFSGLFNCPVIESDQYFTGSDGVYRWNESKMLDSYDWTKERVIELMSSGEPKICVANTFIEEFEIVNYYLLAEKWGYTVFTTFLENRHGGVSGKDNHRDIAPRMEFKLEAIKRMSIDTEITPKFDKTQLDSYVDRDLLTVQKHPTHDLWIYNYSKNAEYLRWWDSITLQARGLVVDSEGGVVARPFKKFFNFEDVLHRTDKLRNPMEYQIYDKMDGSLGMLFNWGGEWIFSSKGSFQSHQSKMGKKILNRYDYTKLDTGVNWIFEIIYPTNKIVVDYGDIVDIFLLGGINNLTGEEVPYEELLENRAGFPVVRRRDDLVGLTLGQIRDLDLDNGEGFVVNVGGFRTKVKFPNYFRKHSVLTNISSYHVWEVLKSGGNVNDLVKSNDIPDEFYDWLDRVQSSILERVQSVYNLNIDYFNQLTGYQNRGEFAKLISNLVKSKESDIKPGYLFLIYDGNFKKLETSILENSKPQWELPFSNNGGI